MKTLLVIIALLIGGIVSFTFIVGYSIYDALDETANEAVVQQVTEADGRIAIRVPLQEEHGMVISGFKKCTPETGMRDEPDYSASCSNGFCTIVVTFDEKIPDSIGLYVEKGDGCRYERFTTQNRTRVVNYFARIEMTDTLKSALETPLNGYDVGSLKSLGRFAYQLTGSKKVILNYGENRVTGDLLTINGMAKASIIFE